MKTLNAQYADAHLAEWSNIWLNHYNSLLGLYDGITYKDSYDNALIQMHHDSLRSFRIYDC
jgi:hypothetical protein